MDQQQNQLNRILNDSPNGESKGIFYGLFLGNKEKIVKYSKKIMEFVSNNRKM